MHNAVSMRLWLYHSPYSHENNSLRRLFQLNVCVCVRMYFIFGYNQRARCTKYQGTQREAILSCSLSKLRFNVRLPVRPVPSSRFYIANRANMHAFDIYLPSKGSLFFWLDGSVCILHWDFRIFGPWPMQQWKRIYRLRCLRGVEWKGLCRLNFLLFIVAILCHPNYDNYERCMCLYASIEEGRHLMYGTLCSNAEHKITDILVYTMRKNLIRVLWLANNPFLLAFFLLN